MADQVQPPADDKTVEKAIWGFIGTSLTWLSLFLGGMAVERLGLTSGILSGILPGETGSLRTQAEECESNFASVKLERDICKRSEDTLRTEISRLKAANTPAP